MQVDLIDRLLSDDPEGMSVEMCIAYKMPVLQGFLATQTRMLKTVTEQGAPLLIHAHLVVVKYPTDDAGFRNMNKVYEALKLLYASKARK